MTADPRATALFLGAFFDELARWGVRDVVVSPGSRSTPLSMTAFELSRRAPERMRVFVDVDERGAAFFALGLAKASGRPAASCARRARRWRTTIRRSWRRSRRACRSWCSRATGRRGCRASARRRRATS